MLRIKTLMAFTLVAACGLALAMPLFEAPKRRGGTITPTTPQPTGATANLDINIFKC